MAMTEDYCLLACDTYALFLEEHVVSIFRVFHCCTMKMETTCSSETFVTIRVHSVKSQKTVKIKFAFCSSKIIQLLIKVLLKDL
jgi:hypothetical protein